MVREGTRTTSLGAAVAHRDAGPMGLVMGSELDRHGIHSRIVDRAPRCPAHLIRYPLANGGPARELLYSYVGHQEYGLVHASYLKFLEVILHHHVSGEDGQNVLAQ